ncbi:MAG: OmpA family protein, partial [Duncaniella sp.]|nr:OmpA family protein [Duncaniella sp.]
VVSDTTFSSVRFVFFRIGQSKVAADQLPNVEMIADYMKHNPESTVVIKGYASQDGNLEFNERLAQSRAQSVKDVLIKKYGVKADRIKAEGQGIGHMFKEESWNRVAICTLDEPSK